MNQLYCCHLISLGNLFQELLPKFTNVQVLRGCKEIPYILLSSLVPSLTPRFLPPSSLGFLIQGLTTQPGLASHPVLLQLSSAGLYSFVPRYPASLLYFSLSLADWECPIKRKSCVNSCLFCLEINDKNSSYLFKTQYFFFLWFAFETESHCVSLAVLELTM